MFCSQCGAENKNGDKFCKKCGAALGAVSSEVPVVKAPEKSRKGIGMIAAVLVVVVLLVVILKIIGGMGKNSYAGYYIFDPGRSVKYALCLNKDHNADLYMAKYDRCLSFEGYWEKKDGYADLYVTGYVSWGNYDVEELCPLHIEISDDGKRMYLSSDNSRWTTDTYDKVDKKEYETFCRENGISAAIEEHSKKGSSSDISQAGSGKTDEFQTIMADADAIYETWSLDVRQSVESMLRAGEEDKVERTLEDFLPTAVTVADELENIDSDKLSQKEKKEYKAAVKKFTEINDWLISLE